MASQNPAFHGYDAHMAKAYVVSNNPQEGTISITIITVKPTRGGANAYGQSELSVLPGNAARPLPRKLVIIRPPRSKTVQKAAAPSR